MGGQLGWEMRIVSIDEHEVAADDNGSHHERGWAVHNCRV